MEATSGGTAVELSIVSAGFTGGFVWPGRTNCIPMNPITSRTTTILRISFIQVSSFCIYLYHIKIPKRYVKPRGHCHSALLGTDRYRSLSRVTQGSGRR